MAKHLIQTTSRDVDILIIDRFVSNRDEKNNTEWANKEEGIARGKTIADTIILYSTEHNDIGNPVVRKVWINPVDIKSIYEAIQEIETITTGKESDDLPF